MRGRSGASSVSIVVSCHAKILHRRYYGQGLDQVRKFVVGVVITLLATYAPKGEP